MKNVNKLRIIFLALILIKSVLGQSSFQLPAKVKTQFSKEFPESKILNVELINNNDKIFYEIETIINKKIVNIVYTSKGKQIKKEVEILLKEVPKNVIKNLKRKFRSIEILTVKKVVRGKNLSFLFDSLIGNDEFKIEISTSGKVLKKTQIFEPVEMGC